MPFSYLFSLRLLSSFDSIYLCIAQHFVRLVCWLLYGHSLSVTGASPLLKGSYAVVNPPIKYITRDQQSDTMMMMGKGQAVTSRFFYFASSLIEKYRSGQVLVNAWQGFGGRDDDD